MIGIPSTSRPRIAFLGGTHGDWGGASRVLFNTLKMLDRSAFDPVVLLPRGGPAEQMLRALGIEHVLWPPLPEASAGAWRFSLAVVEAMRRLRALRADLLDINYHDWAPPEIIAARLLRIPVVVHFHLIVPRAGPFVRFASAVIAVSRFAARESHVAGRRLEVVPNTVELDRFDQATSLRTELGFEEDDVVVSFVGQIRASKGIDAFIRAARRTPGDRLRFLIAGQCRDNGDQDAYGLERLRREIDGETRIRYLGFRKDVERVFRSSDILVVPSRWGEPFGLINVEAGAVGIPVVATRDGGIPEIIRDGENGLLIDVGDEEGLQAAIQRLVDAPELRRQLGRCARQIVESEFTTAPVRQLERIYLDLLGRRLQ